MFDKLIPYFKTGLENNEYCIWLISEDINRNDVENAMQKGLPDYEWYIDKNQLELISYQEAYLKKGVIDIDKLINDWMDKYSLAMSQGYKGLRISSNIPWFEKHLCNHFVSYEEKVNKEIANHFIITLCNYPYKKYGPEQVLDIIYNHHVSLIKKDDKWINVTTLEQLKSEDKLKGQVKELDCLYKISQLDEIPNISDEELLQKVLELVPSAFQFPNITQIKIELNRKKFQTKNYKKTKWTISTQEKIMNKTLKITVNYLENKPFLEEEKEFLKEIGIRLKSMIQRKNIDVQLRKMESERKYRELFNNINSGVAVYRAINDGEDFELVDLNTAAERIEQIKKEQILGKRLLEVFPGVRKLGLFKVFQRVWHSGIPEQLPASLYEDIRIIGWRKNAVYKLPSGEIVAVYDDVTKEKMAEQKLKKSEEKYREAYNLVNFYKDLFAHDMNNILQAIVSSAEYYSLFKNDPIKLNELGDLSVMIQNHARRGVDLVSIVRKLSQLNEAEPELKPIDIHSVLKESIENTISAFKERNVNIDLYGLSEDMIVLGNELLVDVFDNILNNAVKYNDNEVVVEVEIKISKVKKKKISYIKFEFIDHGIGVPDEKKNLLFERSYTKDISKRGMGLGLSLVKKILDKYGGIIKIQNRVKTDYSKGSNFVMMLQQA